MGAGTALRARALLTVERDRHGNHVVRELRSMAPLTLVPHRRQRDTALVHLVSSVTAPLGGDDLELTVRVGAGARLVLRGVAATLALPGHRPGGSRALVSIEAAEGAHVTYLPEPTVVTGRACHEAEFSAELAADAHLLAREVLVLGRSGERPGRLASTMRIRRGGRPALHQRLEVGRPELDASPAHLAGKRVVATEVAFGADDAPPAGGEWWSRVPLAGGGTLTTVLADDVVEVTRLLPQWARNAHAPLVNHR